MASISCFSSSLHFRSTPSAAAADKGPSPCTTLPITVQYHKTRPQYSLSSLEEGHGVNRRHLILSTTTAGIAALSTLPNSLALNDETDDFSIYTDDENKFKIEIPQEWQIGTGESAGFKLLTAFYPKEASNSNVSVVITGVGPDFTKMESFGKVEEFADTLVSGLDRSWRKPPGVTAKLIDCKSSKGFYYIEYTLQNPGESRKHLYSAIGMLTNGWYNRLYTVTGQFGEEETNKYSSKVQKAVRSFKFI